MGGQNAGRGYFRGHIAAPRRPSTGASPGVRFSLVSFRPTAGIQRSHQELSFDGAIDRRQKISARPRTPDKSPARGTFRQPRARTVATADGNASRPSAHFRIASSAGHSVWPQSVSR